MVIRNEGETRLLQMPQWHDQKVSVGVADSQATWNRDALASKQEFTVWLEALRSSGLPFSSDLLATISGKIMTPLGEAQDKGVFEVKFAHAKKELDRRLELLKEDFAEFFRTGTTPPDTEFPSRWFLDEENSSAIRNSFFSSYDTPKRGRYVASFWFGENIHDCRYG